jgi:hypothetical protein
MKSPLVGLSAWLVCTTACLGAPSKIDTPFGHVTLPKGKYVLTNTDTGSTVMINIDEHGIVRGQKQALPSNHIPTATPAASPTTVNPVDPATVQLAPDAAGNATTPANSQKAISDKLKREAQRALKRGDVQKLIRKVGL